MTGQRRKQAQMGEHSRMNRTEFMRQLESLLQNISATEREEALQYYNEYFNDAGPENEQNVIEALGNPAKDFMAHFDAGCGTAVDLITGEKHDFGGGSLLPAYSAYFWLMEN